MSALAMTEINERGAQGSSVEVMSWPTVDDRAARGKRAPADASRASHGDWAPWDGRPDPIGLLERQATSRVPQLVPIRYGRMLVSPFAFFRGAAAVMASDLARTPQSGISVQLCVDAHLSNFGAFASPERQLLFDLNDFDETLPGPWECDVKRLAASFAIAGRHRGFSGKRCPALARLSARSYREAMLELAGMTEREVWYAKVGAGDLEDAIRTEGTSKTVKRFHKVLAKSRRKDSARAFEKLTAARVGGTPKIVPDHPLIVPVEDLLPFSQAQELAAWVQERIDTYRSTLPAHYRRLLDRYQFAHLARKVVGVGSVGTPGMGRFAGRP
jgi:hypothetical protein